VIPAAPLGAEFVFRISRDVDLAPELPLDSPQSGEELVHIHRANNQQIDVAYQLWQVNNMWPSWAIPSRDGKYVAIPVPTFDSNVWVAENF
jgi:hypothetical protein